jgi:hypothetical protein
VSFKRIFLGLAVAPLATPLVFGLVWVANGTADFAEIRGVLLLITIFAYSSAILFGIPLTIAIRRRRESSKSIFTTAGALVGLLMAAALDLGLKWFHGVVFYVLCVGSGSLSGLVLCLIAFDKAISRQRGERN